jgi:ATP-dependent DNA helicase HFM1/MER3
MEQVSRMKTLHRAIRCIAVSATIPNANDVAEWLGDKGSEGTDIQHPAMLLEFDDSYRPVPLKRVVLGYPTRNMMPFLFDQSLDQK